MGKKNASKDNGKAKPRDPPPPNPKVLRSSGGSKPAVWLVAPAMIALLAAGVAYVGWPQGAPPHATLHQQNVTSAVESAASAAASASSAELPRGWGSAMDPSSGKPYYYKLATRESTWERPTEPCDDESVVASAEQQQQQLGKEGEDVHEHCGYWAAAGECASNPSFMEQQCKTSCAHTAAALKSGKAARGLASGKVDTWKTPSDCLAWATSGECENNKPFMLANCAASCSPEERAAAEERLQAARSEYWARCPRPAGAEPALAPGAMNETFQRILADFGHLQPELLSADPPVLLFHSFLSDAEADTFVAHGRGKYAESRGVGFDKDGKMTDVKTEIRTSRHTWCQERDCLSDPLVQAVQERVSDVTRTPVANGEFAQLVYYNACPAEGDKSCAFYKRHSDYIDGDRHRVQGVRIFTLFMYLNDVPEGGGGGTRFTDLKPEPITFMPSRGKAVLWPSVLADAPDTMDPRTHHEALR